MFVTHSLCSDALKPLNRPSVTAAILLPERSLHCAVMSLVILCGSLQGKVGEGFYKLTSGSDLNTSVAKLEMLLSLKKLCDTRSEHSRQAPNNVGLLLTGSGGHVSL